MATMQLQSLELETPPLPIQPPPPANGIVYGFRTRHLSCIEENDSDSQHGSSMPRGAYDLMQQADETFRKLSLAVEAADEDDDDGDDDNDDDDEHDDIDGHDELDTIPMIDESRLCDADYLDELIATESTLADSGNVEEAEEMWQPSFNRNDIMMTSCYGTLNSSFGSDMTTASMAAPAYGEQLLATPRKAPEKEPLYATPEKRRENNRSFDSTCASQTSSIYGGSMNSSLDLKYMMSVSLGGAGGGGGTGGVGGAFNAGNLGNGGISATSTLRGASVPPLDLSLMSSDGISALDWGSASVTCVLDKGEGNPAEELNEEMAAKCLSAAESGK